MKTLLGIGTAGSNVVKKFKKFKKYNVYSISNEIEKNTKFDFKLPYCDHPEEYEKLDCSKINKFLERVTGPVSIFLCGANNSTALILKLLENLYKRAQKMEIFYIAPETEVLGKTKLLQERAARGVLQQYARSGLFTAITLVSNKSMEVFLDSVTIMNYYEKLNESLASTCHMIDVFKNSKPVVTTFSKIPDHFRVRTIGVSSCDDSRDEMFYPFEGEREVRYYFAINEKKLQEQEGLHRKLLDKVAKRITENTSVSYSVVSTTYDQDYVYVEYYSSKIQESS